MYFYTAEKLLLSGKRGDLPEEGSEYHSIGLAANDAKWSGKARR